ncbi:unnamed protein product, partial [marine sediment metagenome]
LKPFKIEIRYLFQCLGVSALTQKFYPYKGRQTLKRLIKREIESCGDEITVEELLDRLKKRGYLKEPIR